MPKSNSCQTFWKNLKKNKKKKQKKKQAPVTLYSKGWHAYLSTVLQDGTIKSQFNIKTKDKF